MRRCQRALEQLHREQGLVESPTLTEFVDVYLAQHEGEPETTVKLRWLSGKAARLFGERRLSELRSPAIAAWPMTIPPGHRFEATQALRQVLARAVSWELLDVNPAKLGVENRGGPFRKVGRRRGTLRRDAARAKRALASLWTWPGPTTDALKPPTTPIATCSSPSTRAIR